jgi:poly-gamma-glutamate synthesis protein (capsule biosynthesis protein)
MSHRFPYRFTPEVRLPRWQQLRVEGLSFFQSVLNAGSYIRKSVWKKHTAPAEELRYFAAQRQLLRHLWRQRPDPGGGSVRLGLVGDIMWIRDGWDSFLDGGLLDHLNRHDAVLGNLESPISPRFKVPSLLPDYFTYNSHPDLVRSFRRPGGGNTFAALSLANNHALDRGEVGARDTQELLGELGIRHSGVLFHRGQRPYTLFEVNGLRVGFYAASWGINFGGSAPNVFMNSLPPEVFAGDTVIDLPEIRRVLADMAADRCDLRVVAPHWGYEFEYYPDPAVMRVGHAIVRAGADLVLGTHPHVQQPLEVLFVNGYERRLPEAVRPLADHATLEAAGPPRKALIAYSLGNFASTMFTFACKVGWVLSLSVYRDPTTRRTDWGLAGSAFVVNVPRFGHDRTRRLLLADDYRRLARERGGLPAAEEQYLAFLNRHLLGRDEV